MKDKSYLFFGTLFAILPVLGLSDDSKSYIVFISGLLMLFIYLWVPVLDWLKLKPKPKKRTARQIKDKNELHIEPINDNSDLDK